MPVHFHNAWLHVMLTVPVFLTTKFPQKCMFFSLLLLVHAVVSLELVPPRRKNGGTNDKTFKVSDQHTSEGNPLTDATEGNARRELQGEIRCPSLSEIVGCASHSDEELLCRECVKEPWEAFHEAVHSSIATQVQNGTIYMPVIVPPFFGSSVLNKILETSPATSSMCTVPAGWKKIPWQCEPTRPLIKERVFDWETRWEPELTNWTRVYETYHRLKMWENPEAPILLEKAPPNIAKVKGMVEFFDSNDMDYRMVVMWRHPCRTSWLSPIEVNIAPYLKEIMAVVPKTKRFFINYDDLILQPRKVASGLLSWLPQLKSLSFENSKQRARHPSGRMLGGLKYHSLGGYVFSSKCTLHVIKEEYISEEEMSLWEQFVGHMV